MPDIPRLQSVTELSERVMDGGRERERVPGYVGCRSWLEVTKVGRESRHDKSVYRCTADVYSIQVYTIHVESRWMLVAHGSPKMSWSRCQEFSDEALTEEREDQMDQSTSKQEETEGVEQPHSSTQMSFPKIEALELKAEEDPFQSFAHSPWRPHVEESSCGFIWQFQ